MLSALDAGLVEAVRRRDLTEVRRLVEAGADINARDDLDGLTVLMIAAGQGNADTVRTLLAAGADVHRVEPVGGASTLHKAVQGGDLDTVRLVVEAGAFIDAVAPTTGHTPLLEAFWYKWPDVVEYLVSQNASYNLNTHYGFSMRDHFEYALNVNTRGRERLEAADAFLKQRMAADQATAAEQELMAATAAGDVERVRALLESGTEVDTRYPILNEFNDGHTPLLVACRDGHTEIVTLLLAAGADVNATEPVFGAVPLHKAVYNGHADITQILVDTPGVDVNFRGATNGYSPLHDSLWHGFEDCARILMKAGARLDLVGHDGKTPYDMAAEVFGVEHQLTVDLAAAAQLGSSA